MMPLIEIIQGAVRGTIGAYEIKSIGDTEYILTQMVIMVFKEMAFEVQRGEEETTRRS